MKSHQFFKPNLLAVAVSLAFPVAAAHADEVAELISPDVAQAAVTVQNLSKVNPLYRKYSGMEHEGVNGSLDLDYVKRSDSGRWLKLEGRDLGLRNQELKAGIEQQGDWSVGLGVSQLLHTGPYEVSTAVNGIGSNTLSLPATLGFSETTLKTERTATSLTAKKFISDNMSVSFGFKNEDKKGARLMGANGNNLFGTTGMLFTPEPIDSTHQQFEASFDYFSKKYQVSAGYYGSFFQNQAGNALFVNYGTDNSNVVSATPTSMNPLSLAPDNNAHEFYLSGGYNWTDDTRGNLKVSKTFARQDDSFMSGSLITVSGGNPSTLTTRPNLGGKVDTTNIFASVTSHVTRELNLLASWAYEDQQDKTPKDVYLIDYSHGGMRLTNNPESQQSNRGKFEATYRLPRGYAVTAGYDYDQKKYPDLAERYRNKVEEQTYRVDLRKSLSDTLNGSIRLAHSKRDGSDWNTVLSPAQNTAFGQNPAVGEFWTAPTQFSDRERDKARLMLDWLPLQALSVQFAYEYSNDDYGTRVSNIGLKKGKAELYSLDAMYQMSENWKSNLWYSRSTNDINQGSQNSSFGRTCQNTLPGNTCVPWEANLRLTGDSVGIGVDGKVNGRIDVGAKAFYTHDVNRYDLDIAPLASTAVPAGAGILPDTVYTQKTVRLYGKYAVSKATAVRLDYLWDKRELNDYAWTNWTYSDGTRIFWNPHQVTQIIGATLIQSF